MFAMRETKNQIMNIQEIIDVPEANGMPFVRWEAYMIATAISMGYHGRFSFGTLNGMSRITVFKKE
jgi:hypothetical protein